MHWHGRAWPPRFFMHIVASAGPDHVLLAASPANCGDHRHTLISPRIAA